MVNSALIFFTIISITYYIYQDIYSVISIGTVMIIINAFIMTRNKAFEVSKEYIQKKVIQETRDIATPIINEMLKLVEIVLNNDQKMMKTILKEVCEQEFDYVDDYEFVDDESTFILNWFKPVENINYFKKYNLIDSNKLFVLCELANAKKLDVNEKELEKLKSYNHSEVFHRKYLSTIYDGVTTKLFIAQFLRDLDKLDERTACEFVTYLFGLCFQTYIIDKKNNKHTKPILEYSNAIAKVGTISQQVMVSEIIKIFNERLELLKH